MRDKSAPCQRYVGLERARIGNGAPRLRPRKLTVQVEAHESVTSADRPGLGQDLCRHVKNQVGVTVTVDVVDPHALERSLGKAKRISDRRT